jgi:ADP-ribosyl-[dinitrogen reductase] hydrolase
MSCEPRTSVSHPLQIATVHIGGGRIGVTFAPGKTDPDAMSGHWRRDLAVDLDAVKAWGADAVVSLIEDHEFETLAIPMLGAEVRARGMEWIHAPIRDISVPDAKFDAAWPATSAHLRDILSTGGAIVIHCRGGIGRACMIAARIMVELGEKSDAAIDLLRRVRHPHAVETKLQEAWVADGARVCR